jgi:uncharacterized DUF497 family protein
VQIDFDPEKDACNLDKHGVSLARAAVLDWEAALTTWLSLIERTSEESSAFVAPTVAR